MAGPPPPPPPPANLKPFNPPPSNASAGGDRNALLGSIQGGFKLKKTVTVDKSKPLTSGPSNNAPSSGPPVGGIASMLGGVKLKSTNPNIPKPVTQSEPKLAPQPPASDSRSTPFPAQKPIQRPAPPPISSRPPLPAPGAPPKPDVRSMSTSSLSTNLSRPAPPHPGPPPRRPSMGSIHPPISASSPPNNRVPSVPQIPSSNNSTPSIPPPRASGPPPPPPRRNISQTSDSRPTPPPVTSRPAPPPTRISQNHAPISSNIVEGEVTAWVPENSFPYPRLFKNVSKVPY